MIKEIRAFQTTDGSIWTEFTLAEKHAKYLRVAALISEKCDEEGLLSPHDIAQFIVENFASIACIDKTSVTLIRLDQPFIHGSPHIEPRQTSDAPGGTPVPNSQERSVPRHVITPDWAF